MKISVYAMAVDTFVPMLRSLSNVLEKGAEFAKEKKIDPKTLVNERLAPDMFTLAQQVQLATDQAKDSTAQLMGKEAPRFENNEQTIDELKARIAKTLDFLAGVRESALDKAEDREIKFSLPDANMEFAMNGLQFLRDWALPHFYFHVVTAYDILRHKGVQVGKRDYVSHVGQYIRQRG